MTEQEMWQAVADRDAAFDGRFYTGVKSTGIFCRPSCPSRRPLRRNAVFFETADDARLAGYRACLRCKPDRWERRGPECIAFAVGETDLGSVVVGGTNRGVCWAAFGDNRRRLIDDLSAAFPNAGIVEDATVMGPQLAEVLARLAGSRPQAELTLDVKGTPFQTRVWAYLQTIPVGETRTYESTATELGLGKTSTRAVAGAIAANPIAVLIPCHRVVRKDGSMGGYRWGLDKKRSLLARESPSAT